MSVLPVPAAAARDREGTLRQLQDRIHRMQDGLARVPVATPEALADLIALRSGGVYAVDGLTLATTLAAPASAQGAWSAVVGIPEWGVEAAAEQGMELGRTVLVPDPGEHWVEVTAALVDVATVVVLRPPRMVPPRTASRLVARLRKQDAILVVCGDWPGCEARLRVVSSAWSGIAQGRGRLSGRQLRVEVRHGAAPPRTALLGYPETGMPFRVESDRPRRRSLRATAGLEVAG